MEINGDCVLDESFARSLTANHHGLKHVRTMRVCDPGTLVKFAIEAAKTRPRTEIPEEKVADEQTSMGICHLLSAMPKHSLTRLEYVLIQIQSWNTNEEALTDFIGYQCTIVRVLTLSVLSVSISALSPTTNFETTA